jgi:uncharacterized protein (TIGR02301 family)
MKFVRLSVRKFAIPVALAALIALAPAANAQTAQTGERPYDTQLLRLAEILGAVHYLRELCGAGEEQTWRLQMKELLVAEGTPALRKAQFIESFNKGYRSYSRTYRTCNKSAIITINRFMEQGNAITGALLQENR